jgi:hypothetical protein
MSIYPHLALRLARRKGRVLYAIVRAGSNDYINKTLRVGCGVRLETPILILRGRGTL